MFFCLQLARVDCRDALEMICNLEADSEEKAAFTLCSGFLTRQILQEDSYCAWYVTTVTIANLKNTPCYTFIYFVNDFMESLCVISWQGADSVLGKTS